MILQSDHLRHFTFLHSGKYGNAHIYCLQTLILQSVTLFTGYLLNKAHGYLKCSSLISSVHKQDSSLDNSQLSPWRFMACTFQGSSYSWGKCVSHFCRNPCSTVCMNTSSTYIENETYVQDYNCTNSGNWCCAEQSS